MPANRHSCARCDGEVFLLAVDGRVICAGCRAENHSLRVVDPRLAERGAEASSVAKP
jgi:hypothetical protein